MTPHNLHALITRNDLKAVKETIDCGVDINAKDVNGDTLLIFALEELGKGAIDEAIIEYLLEYGADVNLADSDGFTPLHMAICLNSKFIKTLIEKGADINAKDVSGNTPLIFALEELDVGAIDEAIIEYLLEYGADINLANNGGFTPLHMAIYLNSKFIKTLIEKGADINAEDVNGNTPLMLALKELGKGAIDESIIKYLLECSVDVNFASNGCFTPLHAAILLDNPFLVQDLLDRGAEVNALNNNGDTPLLFALKELDVGAIDESIIKYLLEYGADVNLANNDGFTPLHAAILLDNPFLVQDLLDRGAEVNALNNDGGTPLIFALDKSNKKEKHANANIKCLLKAGADVTIGVDTVTENTAINLMSKRSDLFASIKGELLSLFLFSTEVIQSLESDEFLRRFCETTKLPLELYLNIVEYVKLDILGHIIPEIPLEKQSDWLAAYQEEKRCIENQASEQALPETRYRP